MPGEFFYTFDPVGHTVQLFNKPQTETSITHISAEVNVPGLLRRRALFDELEARRQALLDNVAAPYSFFDDRNEVENDNKTKKHSVFEIYTGDGSGILNLIPPEEVMICNLEECCTVPTGLNITVAVDPVLGKFRFLKPVNDVRVNYSYGFNGDLGAGTYDRQESIADIFQNGNVWQAGVSKSIKHEAGETIHTSVKDAVDDWNAVAAEGTIGVIVIMDSCSYAAALDIEIKAKSQLLIIAANWPLRDKADGTGKERRPGDIAASDLRPHLNGDITVRGFVDNGSGADDFSNKTGGELTINGLLIEGKLSVNKGNLGILNIISSTLIPDHGGLEIGAGIGINDPLKKLSNQWLNLNLEKTISGPVLLNMTPLGSLQTIDCIIGNGTGSAVDAETVPVQFIRSTFLGHVIAKIIEAENSIFNNNVEAIRRQAGCMRYCFLSVKNKNTPRRYRCQPELEIRTQIEDAKKLGLVSPTEEARIRNNVAAWLVPIFTSINYGHHAYAQLAATCPGQIGTGADNGSEIGAFSFLMNPQRAANLRITLDEYLRLGLEAGIFFAT
jgi:hypothetical protein